MSDNSSETSSLVEMHRDNPRLMNPVRKFPRQSTTFWLTLTIVSLSLSVLGIIIVTVIWCLANQLIFSYGIIIDAGSTSTKVYLYSWPEVASRTNGEVFEVDKCRSSPGISDFVDSVENAYIGIKYCLEEELLPKIPWRLRKKSFVYLGATAGMRLVEETNPNATLMIFEAVENYLLTTDLRFNKSLNDIKIISGEVEGIGAWISVNYLKGTLQTSTLSNIAFAKEEKTYGALDLGGASTQITFVPDIMTNKVKEKTIRLYGNNYSVYSHSYLCYGKSYAEYRLLAHIIQNVKIGDEYAQPGKMVPPVDNPCMLKGDKFTYPIQEILTAPCMTGQYAINNFGYEITYPETLIGKVVNVTFRGSGEVDKCQLYIDKLFLTNKCDSGSCAFNNVYRPKLTDRFLAFSGFELVEKLLRKRSTRVLDYEGFEASSREYCQEKPPDIDDKDMESPRIKELETFRKWRCFDFLYVFNLLKHFGFDKDNWKSIQFVAKINNANLGWSLGYMINKTALVPIEQPLVTISLGTFLTLLILFLLMLAIGLLFALLAVQRYRSSRHPNISVNTTLDDHKSPEEINLCKV